MLLLSRDEAYLSLNAVIAAPLTSTVRAARSLVRLEPGADGVPQTCVVSLDHLQTVSTEWLGEFLVLLQPDKMREVERAIHFALGLSY